MMKTANVCQGLPFSQGCAFFPGLSIFLLKKSLPAALQQMLSVKKEGNSCSKNVTFKTIADRYLYKELEI